MIILAIDTSANYLSLALAVGDKRYQSLDQVGNKQSLYILEKINALLKMASISITDLEVIAYIEGPGSFTGLRVGLSVALGLGFGINAKLLAIPVFALYAKASGINNNVLVGIDAQLGQIYLAGINAETLDYFLPPQVINPEQINISCECVLAGNGFSVYQERLSQHMLKYKLPALDYPGANYMLDIAGLNKYRLLDPGEADLVYLRNKVAFNLEEQQNRKA